MTRVISLSEMQVILEQSRHYPPFHKNFAFLQAKTCKKVLQIGIKGAIIDYVAKRELQIFANSIPQRN